MELKSEDCLREIQGAMNSIRTNLTNIQTALGVVESFLYLLNRSGAASAPPTPAQESPKE